MPASAGFYLLEVDGVSGSVEASEISELKLKHEAVQLHVGTREKPIQVRGKSTVEVVTVKHARAFNSVIGEIFQWFNDYTRGVTVEKRNVRVVTMDESGLVPVETVDLIDCVPGELTFESHKGEAKELAMFSFSVQPSDLDFVG